MAQVFGPDRPMARRLAFGKLEQCRAILADLNVFDVRYDRALANLRAAENACAPYRCG